MSALLRCGYDATVRRLGLSIALSALFAAVVAGCGGSEQDFEADIVAARDRAQAGLTQVTAAESFDDLLERLRTAATEVRGAATDVREADAPDDLADEEEALEDALRALSDELAATANTFEESPETFSFARGFDFQAWNLVQDRLADLRRAGIEVPPLERKAAPAPAAP